MAGRLEVALGNKPDPPVAVAPCASVIRITKVAASIRAAACVRADLNGILCGALAFGASANRCIASMVTATSNAHVRQIRQDPRTFSSTNAGSGGRHTHATHHHSMRPTKGLWSDAQSSS